MSLESQSGPIPAPVYNGFSAPMRQLRRGAGTPAGKILMGGIGAACALGVVAGLLSRPEAADEELLAQRAAAGAAELVQIEVGPGRPLEVPGGPVEARPLQTLPAGADAPDVVVIRAPAAAPAPAARPARQTAESKSDEVAAGPDSCADAATPAQRLACAGEAPAPLPTREASARTERRAEAARPPAHVEADELDD